MCLACVTLCCAGFMLVILMRELGGVFWVLSFEVWCPGVLWMWWLNGWDLFGV